MEINITTIILVILAIFLINKRINRIENTLTRMQNALIGNEYAHQKGLINIVDDLTKASAPLYLLNCFSQLNRYIEHHKNAEVNRIKMITRLEEIEKTELISHLRRHGKESKFEPTDYLIKAISDASSAIVAQRVWEENINLLRAKYFDLLHGSVTVKEANNFADQFEPNVLREGPPYEYPSTDPRVREEFQGFYEDCKNRWQDGNWLNRLEFLKKAENITDNLK
jgi:hypothetical protein